MRQHQLKRRAILLFKRPQLVEPLPHLLVALRVVSQRITIRAKFASNVLNLIERRFDRLHEGLKSPVQMRRLAQLAQPLPYPVGPGRDSLFPAVYLLDCARNCIAQPVHVVEEVAFLLQFLILAGCDCSGPNLTGLEGKQVAAPHDLPLVRQHRIKPSPDL